MLQAMIEKGVNINLTQDAPGDAGATALHFACAHGHEDVVKLLIDAGADDTLANLNGETPAHYVVLPASAKKASSFSLLRLFRWATILALWNCFP